MLVKIEGCGRRRSRERVFAVQDGDANVVEDFADLKDVGLDVGAVALWPVHCIVLEDQRVG